MTKVTLISFASLLALGAFFSPAAVAANSRGGQSANSNHAVPFRHHHRHRIYVPYYYGGYGYDYGVDYAPPPAAPVAKPTAEKPAAEPRRGCEPQSYSVPTADGGESKVTVLRC